MTEQVDLIVFGPAYGLKVFGGPQLEELRSDTGPLASRNISLGVGGMALLAMRSISGSGEQLNQLYLCKQVYESGLPREGHAFGIGFRFANAFPDGSTALRVLKEALTWVEAHCVRSNQFVQLSEFKQFIQGQLRPVLPNLLKEFDGRCVTLVPSFTAPPRIQQDYLAHTRESPPGDDAVQALDAFGSDAGGLLIRSLVILDPASSTSAKLALLPSSARLSAEAIGYLQKLASELQSSFDNLQAELRHTKASLASASERAAECEGKSRTLQQQVDTLSKEVERLRERRQHLPPMADAEVSRIANAVVTKIQPIAAPRPKFESESALRRASPETGARSQKTLKGASRGFPPYVPPTEPPAELKQSWYLNIPAAYLLIIILVGLVLAGFLIFGLFYYTEANIRYKVG